MAIIEYFMEDGVLSIIAFEIKMSLSQSVQLFYFLHSKIVMV